MRRRLTYPNVIATLAFFFSLTGGAMAVGKYLVSTDPIPAASDLTGTYGSPLIAGGKVTTAKIADGAVTSAKIAASARLWVAVASDGSVVAASKPGVTVLTEENHPGVYVVDFGSGTPDLLTCATVAASQNAAIVVSASPLGATETVVTYNLTGQAENARFSIGVMC